MCSLISYSYEIRLCHINLCYNSKLQLSQVIPKTNKYFSAHSLNSRKRRVSRPEVFGEKFPKIHRIKLCSDLIFDKNNLLKECNFTTKELRHRRLPVHFAKLLEYLFCRVSVNSCFWICNYLGLESSISRYSAIIVRIINFTRIP